jgi:hypothetical protein
MILVCAVEKLYRAEQVKAESARARSGYSCSSEKSGNGFLSPPIGFTRGQFQSGQAVGCRSSLPQILPALK